MEELAYQNDWADFSAAWRLAGAFFPSQGYPLPGVKVKLKWNHARG